MARTIQFDAVADVYDYYVNVDFDIPFFLNETKDCKGEILELMCGTGRISISLLESGKSMVCVDYSQGMLDVFARKIWNKNYPAELIQADVTTLDLKQKFDFLFLPFHSLSEILSADLQLEALKSAYRHLKENGIFICTLQNPKVRLKIADGVSRTLGEFPASEGKRLHISYINKYNPFTALVSGYQFYEISDTVSHEIIEKRCLEINFRPVEYREFCDMAKKAGLGIIQTYGDYSCSPFDEEASDFMIFKLIKRI